MKLYGITHESLSDTNILINWSSNEM